MSQESSNNNILKHSYITTVNIRNKKDLYYKSLEFLEFINGVNKGRLSEKEKQVLTFYMMYGYNKETLEAITSTSNINKIYLRTINSNLRTKGYLKKDKYNNHKSDLTESIKELKEYIEEKGPKLFTIFMSNEEKQ